MSSVVRDRRRRIFKVPLEPHRLRCVTRASFQSIQCTSGAKRNFRSCKRIWRVSSICVLYYHSFHEFAHYCPGADYERPRVGEARSPDSSVSCLRHLASDTCQSLDICGGTVWLSRELIIRYVTCAVGTPEERGVLIRNVVNADEPGAHNSQSVGLHCWLRLLVSRPLIWNLATYMHLVSMYRICRAL